MGDYTLLNTVATGTPPAAPALSQGATGGTVAAGTYGAEVSYVNANGETVASQPATITTTGSTSTITITSPAAVPGATGWYAYVTQAGGSTYTRQQTAGSPTAIGMDLTLTAPPSSSGASPVTGDQTGATQDFGAGNTMTRVSAEVSMDPGVTDVTVTVSGSPDGTTWTPILTFAGAQKAAGMWFSPGSAYRAFRAATTGYSGSGAVYVRASFRGGAASSSAGAGIGAF